MKLSKEDKKLLDLATVADMFVFRATSLPKTIKGGFIRLDHNFVNFLRQKDKFENMYKELINEIKSKRRQGNN